MRIRDTHRFDWPIGLLAVVAAVAALPACGDGSTSDGPADIGDAVPDGEVDASDSADEPDTGTPDTAVETDAPDTTVVPDAADTTDASDASDAPDTTDATDATSTPDSGPDASPDGDVVEASRVEVTPSAMALREGDDVVLTMALSRAPTAPVEVRAELNDTSQADFAQGNALIFTPDGGGGAQTLRVRAVDDDVSDGDFALRVQLTVVSDDDGFDRLAVPPIALTILDDDVPRILVEVVDREAAETGDTATVRISLATPPASSVTVQMAATPAGEVTLSRSTLAFTTAMAGDGGWSVPQELTLTGVDDGVADGDSDVTLTVRAAASSDAIYAALAPEEVALVNLDGVCGNGVVDGDEVCEAPGETACDPIYVRPAAVAECLACSDYAEPSDCADVDFVALSSDTQYACALTAAGRIECWGAIVAPPTGTGYHHLKTNFGTACALDADGHVHCWGDYAEDIVGSTAFPSSLNHFSDIALSVDFACGIHDVGSFQDEGELRCWARGLQVAPAGKFTAIDGSDQGFCALEEGGAIVCWDAYHPDEAVRTGTSDFIEVAEGPTFHCGLRTNGQIACWGGENFTTGPGYHTLRTTDEGACALDAAGAIVCFNQNETPVVPAGTGFIDLTADDETLTRLRVCGLRADGSIACVNSPAIAAMPPTGVKLTGIDCGHSSYSPTCVVRADGSLGCYGRLDVMDVPPGDFRSVTVGWAHACALDVGGHVTCWGSDDEQIAEPPGVFREIDGGDDFTCGVRDSGAITCWGEGAAVTKAPTGSNFVSLSAGDEHACAIDDAHQIVCWGSDSGDVGKLAVQPGDYVSVSAAMQYTAAVTTAGAIVTWGDAPLASLVPEYVSVVASTIELCALTTSGGLNCWDYPSSVTPAPAGGLEIVDYCTNVYLLSDGTAVWDNGAALIAP